MNSYERKEAVKSPSVLDPMKPFVSPIQRHQERVLECFDESIDTIRQSREEISQLHNIASKNDFEINRVKTLTIAALEQMKVYKEYFENKAEKLGVALDHLSSRYETLVRRACKEEDVDHLDNFSSGYNSSSVSERDNFISSEKVRSEQKSSNTPQKGSPEEAIIKEFLFASPELAMGKPPTITTEDETMH